MGEVLCVSRGDVNTLRRWVDAEPDRYVVWAGDAIIDHPKFFFAQNNELILQQIASELIFLPFVYEDKEHPVLQNLSRIQSEIHYRVSDFMDQGVQLLSNYKAMLQKSFRLAKEGYGKLKDVPVVICGAGPSIQEAIPWIKKHREHFMLMGCGAGMEVLLSQGIKPDLAVHIDPNPHHKFTRADIPHFVQLRTSHFAYDVPLFLMAGSCEFPLERYLEEKLKLETPRDGGWTAVTRAAALAYDLGSKEIYFSGVDFSAPSDDLYARGAQKRADEPLMQVTLADGATVYSKPDWLLSAEWLNRWVEERSDVVCGLLTKINPLMPSIPSRVPEMKGCVRCNFTDVQQQNGKEVWEEIRNSFAACHALVEQFLAHFQTVFPRSPLEDLKCLQILKEIDEQLVVRLVLDPIWSSWEVVLSRQTDSCKESLAIHRILILKALAERFYV